MRHPGLEEAIRARLDDPEPFLVYADWLAQAGDPRGELIVVQHALEDAALPSSEAARLRGRERELMRVVWPSLRPAIEAELLRAAEWRWGFVDRLHLCRSSHAGDGPDDLFSLARALFDEPPLAVVRSLDIGMLVLGPDHRDAVEELLAMVAEAPAGSSLREAGLGIVDTFAYSLRRGGGYEIGDVSVIGERFPRLQRLTLAATTFHAARGLRLPSLTTLSLEAPTGLAPLLAALDAPRLRHLALLRTDDTDELMERLAASTLPTHLETLDLASGALTDTGAAQLVEAARRSRTLRRVDVTRNLLSQQGIDLLHAAGVTTIGNRTQRAADAATPLGPDDD